MSELVRFEWSEARVAIEDALALWPGPVPTSGKAAGSFIAEGDESSRRLEIRPPRVLPPALEGESVSAWLERAEGPLGLQVLVLLQAGAAALGLFDEGRLVAHRTLRRYVVRGKGRAQPSFLRTKGKSRAGSRLRLRNAERLIEEVGATLHDWRSEHGAFDALFHAVPVRQLNEVLPFAAGCRSLKVPLDLHRPTHEEMLRAWRSLSHGSLLACPPD